LTISEQSEPDEEKTKRKRKKECLFNDEDAMRKKRKP